MFPVFPSPRGCDERGAKTDFIQTLDRIARSMEAGRPGTQPLDIGSQPLPFGWVLKREFSDGGRHVYVPNHPLESEADKEKEARAEGGLKSYKWLAQEYVPMLATVGEIRHMCVNGSPVRTVITGKLSTPGAVWSAEGIRSMITLREIQFVFRWGHGLQQP